MPANTEAPAPADAPTLDVVIEILQEVLSDADARVNAFTEMVDSTDPAMTEKVRRSYARLRDEAVALKACVTHGVEVLTREAQK